LNAFKQQERRKVAVILHFLATKNKEQILFIPMGLLRKNCVIYIFFISRFTQLQRKALNSMNNKKNPFTKLD